MSNTSDYFPPQTTNVKLLITTGINVIPPPRPRFVCKSVPPPPRVLCPYCGKGCTNKRGVQIHVKRYCKSAPPTQEKT